MFTPNRTGSLMRKTGRNLEGEETYGDPVAIGLSIVNLATSSQKTSVRSDSSASRGQADEMAAERGKILTKETLAVDDLLSLSGSVFRVLGAHPRYTVLGAFDHNEIYLELVS
ncbi:hypothetical protein HJB53_30490 [Rhizobium lentis]|uniref:hypothetical protein n=1 Tax=Rhizobium lentis TaxID=1138194 RepID=UPI001C829EBA|nr:hypothetical protein [Rhizobium lentis]MBX5130822.1 hypothetical protein [Rhizobium lentis]